MTTIQKIVLPTSALRYQQNTSPMDGSNSTLSSGLPSSQVIATIPAASLQAVSVSPSGNAIEDNPNPNILVFLNNQNPVEGFLGQLSNGLATSIDYIGRAALTLIPTLTALFLLARVNGNHRNSASTNQQTQEMVTQGV